MVLVWYFEVKTSNLKIGGSTYLKFPTDISKDGALKNVRQTSDESSDFDC